MKRITKGTPDNYLKKLILNAVKFGNHLSEDIIESVLSTPYLYAEEDGEVIENFYGGGMGGIRTGITAMKNAGYLTLYPKDGYGNPTKIKPKRPFKYYLTATGVIHCENPFIKKEHREQRISDEAQRLLEEILLDEPTFQKAVQEFVKTKQVPKLNLTRTKAPIKSYPRVKQETIVIKNPGGYGTKKQIELNSINKISEVQELKDQLKQQKANYTATIQEYENYIHEIESILSQSEIEAVKKFERNLTREEKKQNRYLLATDYANNGYVLDEYFFNVWNGNYIIVILKKLMELGQVIAPEYVDIFSKNSDLHKRRQSRIKRFLSGEEIIDCEFYIKEFTVSGVIIDSRYLEEEKTLKW